MIRRKIKEFIITINADGKVIHARGNDLKKTFYGTLDKYGIDDYENTTLTIDRVIYE